MQRFPERFQTPLAFLLAAGAWLFTSRISLLPEAALSLYRDPDWSYLLNGLALATGTPSGQIDHPGVPLHYLSSVMLRIWHFLRHAGEPLIDSVLLYPEEALSFLATSYATLSAFFLSMFTAAIFRRKGGLAATLFNSILLLNPEVILALGRVNPEIFFLSVTPFFLLTLSLKSMLPFVGVFCVGLLAKVVFFPLCAFAFLWERRRWSAAFALFAALFLLLALPLYPAWPLTVKFYRNLLTHTGAYGSGPHGIFSANEAWASLSGIFGRDPSAFLLALFPAASLLLRKKRKLPGLGVEEKLDLLSLAAALLAFVMVARHGLGGTYPGSRYLLPMVIVLSWRAAVFCARERGAAVAVAVLFLFTIEAVRLKPLVEQRSAFAAQIEEAERGLQADLAAHPACWLLADTGHWTRAVALLVGANFTLGQFGFDLQRIYPRALFVVQPGLSLRNFQVSSWVPIALVEEKRAGGDCFLVAGLDRDAEKFFGKEVGRPLRPHLRLFGKDTVVSP